MKPGTGYTHRLNKEDPREMRLMGEILSQDLLRFTAYFFHARTGERFRMNWHHVWLASLMEQVYEGKIKNLLVNISPGSTKTEMVSISFPAWCYAKNPHCKFINASFSDDRVEMNSIGVRDILSHPDFKMMYPGYEFVPDMNKKKLWSIAHNGKPRGMFTAVSTMGQITGGRAGFMETGFTGAIIIDDPLKPMDAFSDTRRNTANKVVTNTLKSRKANPQVPMVLIMQRLHEMDTSGFILNEGTGDEWTHINIPVEVDDEYIEALPDGIRELAQQMLPEKELGRSTRSYWPYKEPMSEIDKSRDSDFYTYSSQYMQQPTPMGGSMFHSTWWQFFPGIMKPPVALKYIRITVDTAQKTKEANDYSVLFAYGMGVDNNVYILEVERGKWEAPELMKRAKAFINKWRSYEKALLKGVYIEDKVSGTGLIQTLKLDSSMVGVAIIAVQRELDKVSRAMAATPFVQSGRVWLPQDAPWLSVFLGELTQFNAMMTHLFDDIVDVFVTAMEVEYIKPSKTKVKSLRIY